MREAFYPALFEELGIPYTGSDAYTNAITLDKWLTKLVVAARRHRHRRAACSSPSRNFEHVIERGAGLAFPVIVKPNHEGSSKGIYNGAIGSSVVKEPRDLDRALKAALRAYPDGVLVEEYIEGIDVAVGFIEGVGHDDGLLTPVEMSYETPASRAAVQRSTTTGSRTSSPARSSTAARRTSRATSPRACGRSRTRSIRTLGLRDLARLDYRVTAEGRIYLLEANALPALATSSSSLFAATAQVGLTYNATIAAILNAAALRSGLATASQLGVTPPAQGAADPRRLHLQRQARRTTATTRPSGIRRRPSSRSPTRSRGRATSSSTSRRPRTCPRVLAEADVDLIFNIAEGVEGRNREAQVPALCELLGIPYTGSDSATLAIALDKALGKKVLLQHDILTPKFQVMESGARAAVAGHEVPADREAQRRGLVARASARRSVVDNEDELRAAVKELRRALPPARAGRGVHRGPRVHGRPARRQAPARAAADGDQVQERTTRARSTTTRSSRSGRSTSTTSAPRS